MGKPVNMVAKEPKKPYTPPLLLVYGTVRDLTQTQGRQGALDGARPQRTRTHI